MMMISLTDALDLAVEVRPFMTSTPAREAKVHTLDVLETSQVSNKDIGLATIFTFEEVAAHSCAVGMKNGT